MAKRTAITTPYPSVKAVAKALGVSVKRVKEIMKMIDEIVMEEARIDKRRNKSR